MRFERSLARLLVLALLPAGLAVAGLARPAAAQTPPVIDGDMADLLQYVADLRAAGDGATLDAPDPAAEVQVIDPEVIPCPPIVNNYFVNGFDLTRFAMAQAPGSTTLYLGMRVAGVVGDTDGDGSPDNAGTAPCNPSDNIPDVTGIGPDEFYEIQVDSKCETNFDPDGVLIVSDNKVTGTGLFAGVTGSIADGSIAFRGPGGHDLEVRVLDAPLPAHFRVRAFVAGLHAGLTEDFGAIQEIGFVHAAVSLTSAADRDTLCGGGDARITLTVANTGTVPLLLGLADDLPAGLTYGGVPASDCEVLAQGALQSVTWPTFSLAPGASCALSFLAHAGVDCTGPVTNQAHVNASPAAACQGASPTSATTTLDLACSGVPCPTPRPCELTGTGCLRGNGPHGDRLRSTFGGTVEALLPGAPADGASWEHVERDGQAITFQWQSPAAYVTECSDAPNEACRKPGTNWYVGFVGTGRYALGPGAMDRDGNMVASLVEHAAGGCDKTGDRYEIVVRTGGVIGQGDVVYQAGGEVECDRFAVKEFAVYGAPAAAPTATDAAPAVARIGRLAPNPFSATTSFTYEVTNGDGADLAVAVYDVAGRRIRTLATGASPAGRHVVTWDGRDESGALAPRGVYFVRTAIAGQPTGVQRLLFLR